MAGSYFPCFTGALFFSNEVSKTKILAQHLYFERCYLFFADFRCGSISITETSIFSITPLYNQSVRPSHLQHGTVSLYLLALLLVFKRFYLALTPHFSLLFLERTYLKLYLILLATLLCHFYVREEFINLSTDKCFPES